MAVKSLLLLLLLDIINGFGFYQIDSGLATEADNSPTVIINSDWCTDITVL